MKRFNRSICVLLVVVMVFAIPTFATETVAPRASNFFMCNSVYICNVSGNSFEAWFDVTGLDIMDVIGAKTMKIQRSADGENWTTVKTYTMEDYPDLVDYNTIVHGTGVSYTGLRGYYYRVYVQLYAKKGVNVGKWNQYSASIYIPAN